MITYEDFAPLCRIQHPIKGAIPFQPYDFQKKVVQHIEANRFSITLGARQMGSTTTIGSWCLWKAANEPGTKIAIIYNRLSSGLEFLERIRFMVETMTSPALPYVAEITKKSIVFANGSSIEVRSNKAFLPHEVVPTHLLVIDAAWHIDRQLAEFWTSIQPMLSSGTRLVMEGCPHHTKTTYQMIVGGSPRNGISVLHLPWHAHPDRDEAWAKVYRDQLGEKSFKSQFDAEFVDE